MYQYSCLAAARSCCHDNAVRLFIVDDFKLSAGEFTKKLVVFGRCDVLVNLHSSLFLEIMVDEMAKVHREVVVDELHGRVVVAHHQVGKFAHDMNLTYALLVELIQQSILFFSISCTSVG